jgi:hypothetical protein
MLLTEARELRGQGGIGAYKRAKLLVEVFDDADFKLEFGIVDDFDAAAKLNVFVEDLCLGFFELRDLLATYPNQSQWEEGRLKTMYDDMVAERSKPEKQEAKPRARATLAQLAAAEAQIADLTQRLKKAQAKIKALEAENQELRANAGVKVTRKRKLQTA